jgi:S-(hydroxymethyl)glutathione dehydrogenase/alcohol dehydrogenase
LSRKSFTTVSSVELAMLVDTGLTGLAATTTKVRVETGSDVAILGAGPIGLAAVQGARIQGAAQIIVVDPIRYRREAALALGATIALDPNVEGDNLVRKIQELCRGKTGRHLAGGGNIGPDFVIEAVGGDLFPPKTEVGPDPTGIRLISSSTVLRRMGYVRLSSRVATMNEPKRPLTNIEGAPP